jgi:pimeloyl-ACP methyl ester carboxylesterase
MALRTTTDHDARTGRFPNGMEYLTWGDGPRTLLFISGGPGSSVPTGLFRRMSARWFAPFVAAGYAAWLVTRRRHMPAGHTVSGIADDFAGVIGEQFGGSVDLVVGESFGGMIAQHLAGEHPGVCARVALVVAGCEVSDWGKAVDGRLAEALRRGDRTAAGAAFAEYVLPGEPLRPVRRLLAPLVVKGVIDTSPIEDLVTEVDAEIAFDSRAVLPRIDVPVLLVCGDRDQFFPPPVIWETAALISDSRVVWYPGKAHVRAAASSRVPRDVLAFAG